MMSYKFHATISIPTELREVWISIPNKSEFVTKHIKELMKNRGEQLESRLTHPNYAALYEMCNPFRFWQTGICHLCLEEHETVEKMELEWKSRGQIIELNRRADKWNETHGKPLFGKRNLITKELEKGEEE